MNRLRRDLASGLGVVLLALALPGTLHAADADGGETMTFNFPDVELTDVINAIAEKTGTNFIYDDRVRGRVTIISPTEMTVEQAYAVFESVLQVKGFTTVRTPGGALKVIPLREAKETSIETEFTTRKPANRDHFITRLIPLRYIDAGGIVNTLKPLVSKDAAIAAYEPTNTVILTESASNIRRLIAILESVDVETYQEELTVIRVEFADATTLAQQIAEIFGANVSSASPSRRTRASSSTRRTAAAPAASPASDLDKVRIITDARTNSLIVLAPRTQLEEVRRLVRKLDVPVIGGGRIHVYYLQHADAEDLAQTLTAMITGRSAGPRGGGGGAAAQGGTAQAIRATVSDLAGGISVTADPATNALVIQASQEGFNTLQQVIAKLDVARPQVLVEALIMEVDIASGEELGFNGLLRKVGAGYDVTVLQGTDSNTNNLLGVPGLGKTIDELGPGDAAAAAATGGTSLAAPLVVNAIRSTLRDSDPTDADDRIDSGSFIQGVIRAAASDAGTNILSAPHILTSDNEQAEIRVGDNIPIVTSRLDAATGGVTGLSTSVNVERQDIGVTLRVTPQITEGDTLRLDIFQEISTVNTALTVTTSLAAPDSGVALSKRTIENTVVVADGQTVVIGGLIGNTYEDSVSKIPWLGDIPFFGWLFKTTSRTLQKQNLLVFLTPHIVRTQDDLEYETIRKRQEVVDNADDALKLSEREQAWERQRMKEAEEAGETYEPGRGLNPIRHALLDHEAHYPIERMREIEREEAEAIAAREIEASAPRPTYFLQAGLFSDEAQAVQTLTSLVDLGFDGALISDQRGGRLIYEVRVGPYDNVDEAHAASQVLERSEGLSPSIVIESPETP